MRKDLVITQNITNRDTRSIVDFLRDISRFPMLTVQEEAELATAAHVGDMEARDRLVNGNVRFLISVAKQYTGQGVPLDDLIQEGYMGMLRAAELFDPTKGFKFISFAVWWIRQSVESYIAESSRTIRLPMNKLAALRRIRRISARFEQENSRRPDVREVVELMDESESLTPDQIEALAQASTTMIQADAPINSDESDSITFIDTLSSSDVTDAAMDRESLMQTINAALSTLSRTEADILRESFGIGCTESSIDDIAARKGLSRERVRQIRLKGIRSLASGPHARLLSTFL